MLQQGVFRSSLGTAANFVRIQDDIPVGSPFKTEKSFAVPAPGLCAGRKKLRLDLPDFQGVDGGLVDQVVKFRVLLRPATFTRQAKTVGEFVLMQDSAAAG